ncbi:hypothetical protein CQ010_11555 [Arthrobacter sp. MYb211]|uniref:COG4315 family predicted lipoprotein n=1 Tax=Micrococcaceae TaxID=1268 RepID=UPI000CFD2907|nr:MULTISPECIES: hypothetical protein [unclassified Arthrobacter]PRA00882.1 hypothetical protein CQ019_15225 [Arthrobacter sp. MYb229]PRA10829.1 hypothetical protein CQ015_12265 [Arthrobacter sp. MYb221]PRB48816.1 hypothetical protein CQ013_14630 [Arthrobacter sp. MYb216]PRC06889.1 hypothetical protein CQ010_11555 [Arthrobacter sp. MYb211]
MNTISRRKFAAPAAVLFGAALLLAGCGGGAGSGDDSGGGMYGGPKSTSEAPMDTAAGVDLGVASTSLGDVVVDANGMTLYYFTNDTAGTTTSACTGECLANWPIATTTSDTPTLEGVTGEVGTITSPEGEMHLTLNGMPLYTFINDSKAGDVAGQGVNEVWYAVAPDGTMIQ